MHDGAMAENEVQLRNDGLYNAQLANYKGSPEHTPPQNFVFRRQGRHWVSDIANSSLADDLGYAVQLKAKPLLEGRRRDSIHPAG